jgi:hypothetical protein
MGHCSDIENYCQQQLKDRTARTMLDRFFALFAKKRATTSRNPRGCSVDGTKDSCAAKLERQSFRNPGDGSVDGVRAASNGPTGRQGGLGSGPRS